MNSIPKKPGSGGGDDPNIPVLTDRLGFPPLEFDTTLPMIDSTLGRFEDSSLNIPTVQPVDAPAAQPLQALYEPPPAPSAPPVAPPAPPAPLRAPLSPAVAAPPPLPPRSAPLPTLEGSSGTLAGSPRVHGGGHAPLELPPMPPAPPPPPPPVAPPVAAPTAAPVRGPAAPATAGAALESNLNWARIESDACNAVVRKIADRLPLEVENVVRVQMAPAIDRLVAALANDTRLAIAACVREIVTQAVHAEIERMRRTTRGPN